jgi:death-on-curing protein
LDYILDAIQGASFGGFDRYPTIFDKAAAVGYHIITRHVFPDGNKRTGTQVCYIILRANGYEMALEPIDEVEDFILRVADSTQGIDLEAFTDWIRARTMLI